MMKAEVIKDAKSSGWRFSKGQNVGAVLQFFLITVIKFKAKHGECVMEKPGRHQLDPVTERTSLLEKLCQACEKSRSA